MHKFASNSRNTLTVKLMDGFSGSFVLQFLQIFGSCVINSLVSFALLASVIAFYAWPATPLICLLLLLFISLRNTGRTGTTVMIAIPRITHARTRAHADKDTPTHPHTQTQRHTQTSLNLSQSASGFYTTT